MAGPVSPVSCTLLHVLFYTNILSTMISCQVMYNGINLVDIDCPPSSPQKFDRKIVEILFTEKEMMDGTFTRNGF